MAPLLQGFEPALELPVPEFNLEQVGLQYDSQTGYGTAEARQVRGEVWRPLEAAVQPPTEGGPLTWLDGACAGGTAALLPWQFARASCWPCQLLHSQAAGSRHLLAHP